MFKVNNKDTRAIYQVMRTSSDIQAGRDRMFKKYLNSGYPRNFIYSFHTLGLTLYQDYKVRQKSIANCDRVWIKKCDKNFKE